MFIKDSTFKHINNIYMFISIILGIVVIYAIINTMVSLKYETEKEILNYHSNLASDYIRQLLDNLYVFGSYLFFNIIYICFLGQVKLKKTLKTPNHRETIT